MWQVTAICVILGVLAFLYFGYLRGKAASDKVDALERAAAEKREKDRAEDVAEAKEVIDSGNVERAIGFLRDSFR